MKPFIASLAFLSLTACAANIGAGGFMRELPEGLADLASPGQNLEAVKLMEDDNCYWYQHVGQVETTMLPLRSKRGQHICAKPSEDA
ncbi:MAG: hypothetical protein AAF718_01120 [Pseudomonadota bacterium]